MKKLVLIYTLLGLLALRAALPTSQPITLSWDYPTNLLSTNLTFKLYHSPVAVPFTNYSSIADIAGTNLSVTPLVTSGEHYYFVTASNFWGESLPSNLVITPPLPRDNIVMSIRRGP